MKQMAGIAGFVIVILMFVGCQEANKGVDVVVLENGQFPKELAGTWQSDNYGWEFVIEPNGRISSVVVALGQVRIEPGKHNVVPVREVYKDIYDTGQWHVQYTPSSRDLMIEVVIKKLDLSFGGASKLKGSLREVFVGNVSEDFSEWNPTWISFPDYTVYTPEPSKLPVDPNDTLTEMVFTKVPAKAN